MLAHHRSNAAPQVKPAPNDARQTRSPVAIRPAFAAWSRAIGIEAAPAESLVAHWSFDSESDPCNDDTGNGHDCIQSGTTWVDGQLYFDGVDDFLEAFTTTSELNLAFQTYTVYVRFTPEDFSEGILIMRQDAAGGADNFHIRAIDL